MSTEASKPRREAADGPTDCWWLGPRTAHRELQASPNRLKAIFMCHMKVCMSVQVAEECLQKAGDLSGLLLLYTAKGSGRGLGQLIDTAGAQNRQNIVFLCHLLLGNLNACVDLLIASGRIPEAAFFARTYVPSRMTEVSTLLHAFPCACLR